MAQIPALRIAHIPLTAPVILAPMAGITDLPFRRIVARFGAGLVVSEMVASQEVMQGGALARSRAELGLNEGASAVQLVGRDPYWMAEAARFVESNGARLIDINMGCPAKRVTQTGGNGACGSALMREPDLALALMEAVARAVSVPVTVKMRLGWDDASHNAAQLARLAQGAGLAMVTVHGRTRQQFYKGCADWSAIAPVAAGAQIPVIANGDIVNAATARAALQASGAAGVMVGRGAQGAPWVLAQIAADLQGRPVPVAPQSTQLADLIDEHYHAILGHYGRDLGLRVARKHLGWYLDAAGRPDAREDVLTATDPAQVIALMRRAICDEIEVAA